ncbi:hypothetical protein [Caenispirillum bisanense]|uniref:hypothetical protein n=1 Tax=Caenispirillum bisanense TaxID=414052 RepID=UPI0031DF2FAA
MTSKRLAVETLSGPVVGRLNTLAGMPAAVDYDRVLGNVELLGAYVALFRKRRAEFADLLVDAAGAPVVDNSTPVHPCGFSVDEIISMTIRSAARRHMTKDAAVPRSAAAARNDGLLSKIAGLLVSLWETEPEVKTEQVVSRQYKTLAPLIGQDWQIPLIPYYARLPMPLVLTLGDGLLELRTPEHFERLISVGEKGHAQAASITAGLHTEMMAANPLAAKGVAKAGKRQFDRLKGLLYKRPEVGVKNFWEVFAQEEMVEVLGESNDRQIAALAPYLSELGPDTVRVMLAHLPTGKLARFLEHAKTYLGAGTYLNVFGPMGDKRIVEDFARRAMQIQHAPTDLDTWTSKLELLYEAYSIRPG